MCFSPEVDLVAGLVLGAVGIDAVRHVRTPAERGIAVLPLVFAGHQLIEAFAWWGLQGKVPVEVGRAAVWLYLVIAFGVVPVLVPVAVRALDPMGGRGRSAAFIGVGGLAATLLVLPLVRGPVSASVHDRCIAYHVGLWNGDLLTVLYVVATCGSLIVSRQRAYRAWGLVNLGAVLLLGWVNQVGFVSLWCLWAGVTSVVIARHLRSRRSGYAEPRQHWSGMPSAGTAAS